MEGILKLFTPDGTEIIASAKDLLRMEARSGDPKIYRRAVGDNPGTYWLLSARPGHVRMILEIHLSCIEDTWGVAHVTNGIADYSHWDLESTLKTLRHGRLATPGENDQWSNLSIPPNVEGLVREHIYYMPGVKGLSDVRPQFALQIVPANKARKRLAKVTGADVSELVAQLAGRQVEIMELMLTLVDFCEKNEGLTGKEMALAHALTKQSVKLFFLAKRLGAQLARG